MNLTLAEGAALVSDITKGLPALEEHQQVVIVPPYVYITEVVKHLIFVRNVYAGAQNCYSEASGAYTGEISAAMLKSVGAKYVIIGHSERRQYFNETDALLAKKTDQALNSGLKVIFCCGEPLNIRQANTQNAYVEYQLKAGLFHLDNAQLKNIVIAYEPIWAIGTGHTATSQQAQDMHAHIRQVVRARYGNEVAANVSILYGGSLKPSNAPELFSCPDVDGGLIGGASLNAGDFLGIVTALQNARPVEASQSAFAPVQAPVEPVAAAIVNVPQNAPPTEPPQAAFALETPVGIPVAGIVNVPQNTPAAETPQNTFVPEKPIESTGAAIVNVKENTLPIETQQSDFSSPQEPVSEGSDASSGNKSEPTIFDKL